MRHQSQQRAHGMQAMLRLQLLQSPACTFAAPRSCTNGVEIAGSSGRGAIFDLSPNSFTLLNSEGNNGCGFICSNLLSNLLGNTAEAQRLIGVQIRAVVPGLGVFKGMLVRTPLPPGQTPIQLTPSMQKVSASVAPFRATRNSERRACLLFNGMFPHANQLLVGRALNPRLNGPPPKSSKPRPLLKQGQIAKQGMITRLWCALGVESKTCERYTAEAAKSWKRLAHSWVIGVSDPTHEIPFDSVFVTGCRIDGHCVTSQFFTTRRPCIKPSSGKLLQQLTEKPAAMSVEHWEFLLGLPFGGIIFPDAPEGQPPIPASISNGDLDGDWYFVCWDVEVLSQLNSSQFRANSVQHSQVPTPDPVSGSLAGGRENKSWLADSQQLMSDGHRISEHQMLVGMLYKLAEKAADLSDHEFMHDAAAFADAYEQALDCLKHGRQVKLPKHLHGELPRRLQKYLCE